MMFAICTFFFDQNFWSYVHICKYFVSHFKKLKVIFAISGLIIGFCAKIFPMFTDLFDHCNRNDLNSFCHSLQVDVKDH